MEVCAVVRPCNGISVFSGIIITFLFVKLNWSKYLNVYYPGILYRLNLSENTNTSAVGLPLGHTQLNSYGFA
jgi:hypothetical protein